MSKRKPTDAEREEREAFMSDEWDNLQDYISDVDIDDPERIVLEEMFFDLCICFERGTMWQGNV